MIGAPKTSGTGLWSKAENIEVPILKIEVTGKGMNWLGAQYGSVNVYFDTSVWTTDEHGLIYTDEGWLEEFKKLLAARYEYTEDALKTVTYSEQGMQGSDYVNLDVGPRFLRECDKFHRFSAGLEALPADEVSLRLQK